MKPMLAATIKEVSKLEYPLIASPKMDGIRCIIHNGTAVSRSLKPIPNAFVQTILHCLPDGLDGELMLVKDGNWAGFNDVQSAIMSEEGKPDFRYIVFDHSHLKDENYTKRLLTVRAAITLNKRRGKYVSVVSSKEITSKPMLLDYEEAMLALGYEGVMLRKPNSKYKFGRSTLKEGCLMKLKRFSDDEACIIGFQELMHNGNDPDIDELGHVTRSSSVKNLKPMDTLGSLEVRWKDKVFNIGTGFSKEQRDYLWNHRFKLCPKHVTFKYQELTPDGIPRFPVFKGIRHIEDF